MKNLDIFPFYKKARALWEDTQINQIVKGLHKYEEPFTPEHWTMDELLNHALEESVDLVHYLVGMKELDDSKQKEIDVLYEQNEELMDEIHRLERIIETLAEELAEYEPFDEMVETLKRAEKGSVFMVKK